MTQLFAITEHLKPKFSNSFRIYVDSLHFGFPSSKGKTFFVAKRVKDFKNLLN